LDWPTAATRLYDALQTYINVSERLLGESHELRKLPELRDSNFGTDITPEHIDRCRELLREIEPKGVDPSLNDLLNPYE
jgi:hypothetical protein